MNLFDVNYTILIKVIVFIHLSILFQAMSIMQVVFGKDHHYIAEINKEMEEQKWKRQRRETQQRLHGMDLIPLLGYKVLPWLIFPVFGFFPFCYCWPESLMLRCWNCSFLLVLCEQGLMYENQMQWYILYIQNV